MFFYKPPEKKKKKKRGKNTKSFSIEILAAQLLLENVFNWYAYINHSSGVVSCLSRLAPWLSKSSCYDVAWLLNDLYAFLPAGQRQQVLNVTRTFKTGYSLGLKWSNFKATLVDKRQLLGYTISYIEAPDENVTYYDGRDAGSSDG